MENMTNQPSMIEPITESTLPTAMSGNGFAHGSALTFASITPLQATGASIAGVCTERGKDVDGKGRVGFAYVPGTDAWSPPIC